MGDQPKDWSWKTNDKKQEKFFYLLLHSPGGRSCCPRASDKRMWILGAEKGVKEIIPNTLNYSLDSMFPYLSQAGEPLSMKESFWAKIFVFGC